MKATRFVLILVFFMMLITPVGPVASHDVTAKVQPELLQLAAENPEQYVAVIVQKQGQTELAEGQVVKQGGKVTQALSIINGSSGISYFSKN